MPRARNPDKRMKRLSAPANDDELQDYYSACEKVGVEPADTLRKLARAFAEHVKKNGFIVQPIKLSGPPERE